VIESLNAKLRRALKTRGHLPNDDAATKLDTSINGVGRWGYLGGGAGNRISSGANGWLGVDGPQGGDG
jgi:hypothetical protein